MQYEKMIVTSDYVIDRKIGIFVYGKYGKTPLPESKNLGFDLFDLCDISQTSDNGFVCIIKSYATAFEGIHRQELTEEILNKMNDAFVRAGYAADVKEVYIY